MRERERETEREERERRLLKEKKVDEVLNEYSAGQKISKLPLFIDSIFTRYVTISILMDEFFQKLQNNKKITSFPVEKISNSELKK